MKGVLLLLIILGVVAIASMSSGSGSGRLTSSSAATQAPAPITLRPDQMILPPDELPVPGYRVTLDEVAGEASWRRHFETSDSREYRIEVILTVLTPSQVIEQRSFLESGLLCDKRVVDVVVATSNTPVGIGDLDRLCVYVLKGDELTVRHDVLLRNASITVTASIDSRTSKGEPAAMIADAVARRQTEIVARLAPGGARAERLECPAGKAALFIRGVEADVAAWDDLEKLAGATPRIALSPVIQRMQDVRRRVTTVRTYGCMAVVHDALLDYMDLRLQVYMSFMSQREVVDGRRLSEVKFGAFRAALSAMTRSAQ